MSLQTTRVWNKSKSRMNGDIYSVKASCAYPVWEWAPSFRVLTGDAHVYITFISLPAVLFHHTVCCFSKRAPPQLSFPEELELGALV